MTMTAPLDLDPEATRLASLRRMLAIGGPTSSDYVRTVRLARHCLSVPIAYVSIISDDCQCMAAVMGVSAEETPREYSLCLRAIEAGQVIACRDATAMAEFAANPMVQQAPHIRSFVAHPIRSAEGQQIGALCVADVVVRDWSAVELDAVADLAFGLEAVIGLRFLAGSHGVALGRVADLAKAANTDSLTQLLNRRGISDMAHHVYARCHLEQRGFGIALIDLDHFKRVNDTYGHDAGDVAMVETARRLNQAVRGRDLAGRWGGEEFIAVLPAVSEAELAHLGDRLVTALAGSITYADQVFPLTASIGLAWDGATDQLFDLNGLMRRADQALYRAKESGRNCAVVDASSADGVSGPEVQPQLPILCTHGCH